MSNDELVGVLDSSEDLLLCLDDDDDEDDEDDDDEDDDREELLEEDDVLDKLDELLGEVDVCVRLELLMRPAPPAVVAVGVLALDVLDVDMMGSPSASVAVDMASLTMLLEIERMEARSPSKVLRVRTSVVDGSPSSSYRVERGATIMVTRSPSSSVVRVMRGRTSGSISCRRSFCMPCTFRWGRCVGFIIPPLLGIETKKPSAVQIVCG